MVTVRLVAALLLVAPVAAVQSSDAPKLATVEALESLEALEALEPREALGSLQPEPAAWLTRCTSDGRAASLACSLEQRLIVQETGQLFLTIGIHVASPGATPELAFQTPLGLYLPPGLTLQVDDRLPSTIAVATCDANGCHAREPLADPLLADLQAGTALHIRLHTTPDHTIDVEIPLAGFDQSLAAIR